MFSLSLMPTFKQVEPQHLQGLTSGHVLSQLPVSYTSGNYGVPTVTVGDAKYIENGIIVSISNTGVLEAYNGETKQAFIHYDEELDTSDFGTKSSYAVLGEGAETYIRAIALFPGDEFVTDQVNGVMTAGTAYTVANGVISNTGSGNGVQFLYVGGSAFETTLPNGKPGYHFVVLG